MELIGSLELRVAELLHHLKIESAVVQGAKNVVKYLSGQKIQDRRILAEVAEFTLADTVAPWISPLFVLPGNVWLILQEESSSNFVEPDKGDVEVELSLTSCSTAEAANTHTK